MPGYFGLTSGSGTMSSEQVLARPACRSLKGVQVLGTGSYVPDGVISNEHLSHRFGYSPEWIVQQTGIRERRHALQHQATSDLCFEAAQRCLEHAGVKAKQVDLLLIATVTPDMSFPSVACLVQHRLGMKCAAVDMQAACAGFVYALVTGAAYVVSGASDCALIVGGDCMSRVVNPEDRKSYPLMGDGAGAVVLARGTAEQGLVCYSLGSQGSGANLLRRQGCGSRMPPSPEVLQKNLHLLEMDGRAVFNWAASILCDSILDVLKAGGMQPNDVDQYVPHQANIRIIRAAIDVLGIDRARVFTNLEKYGNTSAGSIPIALDEAVSEGRVCRGQRIVLSGFGAGLVWGSVLLHW